MANTFQFKRSSVQGKVPTTSQLALGEIGINTYDGKLYIKKDDGTASIVEIGGSSGSSSAFTGATSSTAGAAGLVPAPSAGDQAKYLQADGTWSVPTDTNTTYSNATTSVSGLMSSGDKSKLDGIQSSAKNFSVGVGSATASTANGNGYLSASNTNYATSAVGTVTFHPPDLSIYYKSGSAATLGSLVVDGSIDSGASDYAGYRSDGTNIILKGDASGRSAIFFQSEKNGTNINHPSDYAYIQYHPYGIDGTTGEANKLVIGVANDSDDTVVLQSPYANGVKISYKNATSGTGGTEYTVWHAGNDGAASGLDADLLDGQQGSYYLDYNNFTNTPTSSGIANVVDDTTPQLGGNLDVNAKNILLGPSSSTNDDRIKFGSSAEFQLYYNSNLTAAVIGTSSASINVNLSGFGGEFFDITDGSLNSIATFTNNAGAELYWRGASGAGKKLETTSSGATVTGSLTATSIVKSGGTSSQYLMADGSVSTGGGGISNLVEDTAPQLGGNLDANGKNIVLGDSAGTTDDRITFGASADLQIYHNGSDSVIQENGTGSLQIAADTIYFRNSANSAHQASLSSTLFTLRGSTGYSAAIDLLCDNNTHSVRIEAPTHANFSSSYTLTLPVSAGSNGQVLTTNGSGVTSWTTVSGGGGSGITAVVDDTTPELGGALDLNGNFIYSNASGLGATYGDVTIQPIATSFGSVHGGLKIHCRDHTSGSSHYAYYFDGPHLSTPGSITATGNVTAYSDIKLKKEIKPIKNALDKVCKINGVTFERTDLVTKSRFAGVIAQEVEQVLPEVVSTDEQGFKSVAYGNLVGLLIEAIKEQQTQIDGLRKAIEER